MTALAWMRMTGFLRTGRALAPLVAGLVVLAVLYGGGQAQAGEAYGVSAAVLFPVLAWQTKLLLDAEPDVQRRLALVAVGPRRELLAGLLAAAGLALVTVLLALVLPWLIGGIRGPAPGSPEPALWAGVLLGGWAHLLAVPAGLALGALASRAVTRAPGYGVAVLVAGSVGAVVLGLRASVAPWLAPPLLATARQLTAGVPGAADVAGLTAWALVWAAGWLAGYAVLRRRRS